MSPFVRFETKKVWNYLFFAEAILLAAVLIYAMPMMAEFREFCFVAVIGSFEILMVLFLPFLANGILRKTLLYVNVVAASCCLAFFALGSVLSFADAIAGVHIWGDAGQLPAMIRNIVLLAINAAISIVGSFTKCTKGEVHHD